MGLFFKKEIHAGLFSAGTDDRRQRTDKCEHSPRFFSLSRWRGEVPPGSICVIPLGSCLDLAVREVEDRARRKTTEMARLGRDAHGQEVEDS
jgi:hypothetical protein